MTKIPRPDIFGMRGPRIDSVVPAAALPGGEIEILGSHLGPAGYRRPVAMIGDSPAPVLLSRESRMIVGVPDDAGTTAKLEVLQNGSRSNGIQVHIARPVAGNIHAVANPAVDTEGNIYATFSGSRGQETPVSVFRIDTEGEMRPFMTGLMNATGLAFDLAGYLYVSSRQEGTVHRVSPEGAASVYSEGMGIATGLAFDGVQNLYVGDRSGTIFKISPDRQIFVFATLEPSLAAYHLAFGLDGTLFVTGPTTSSFDAVYAIDRRGDTTVYYRGLGRPQGLAVDVAGNVYVAASLRGRRGIVRITPEKDASLAVSGSGLVGLCFVPGGGALLATGGAIYHVHLGVEGLRLM
jgi:sugar lactone lactonase YvrE